MLYLETINYKGHKGVLYYLEENYYKAVINFPRWKWEAFFDDQDFARLVIRNEITKYHYNPTF